MLFFAAAPTTLDKLKQVPPDFWWKLALVIVALIVLVFILQKVAKMNKILLAIVLLVVFSVVGVNWIYDRNEPKFLTPVVDKIAPFLPSKGSYGSKQQSTPK